MMAWARIINSSGVKFIESTHFSMSSCPPSRANAAEKMAEPTNSQHTIALVLAVRNDDSLMMVPNSLNVPPMTDPENGPPEPSRRCAI